MRAVTLFVLLLTVVAYSEIINVPDDHETIQGAIDASENGDTVLVAPGEYVENINFDGRAIVVIGNPDDPGEVIIDGDANGHSVVVFRNGEDEDAVLIGFTICNGRSDYGGGVYCNSSSPTLSHLIIRDNVVSRAGAGIYCTGDAILTLSDLVICNNTSAYGGGGISCYNDAQMTLENAVISDNVASEFGGGIQCSMAAEITLMNVTISNNASGSGGGILCYSRAILDFQNGEITGNTANSSGGGVYQYGCTSTFRNVQITDNVSQYDNGAIALSSYPYVFRGGMTLINSTVSRNRGGVSIWNHICHGIRCNDATLTLVNTILWGHLDEEVYVPQDEEIDGRVNVFYCDIEGGRRGIIGTDRHVNWEEGNINSNPQFADPDDGDYHLTEDSPCIDAGDPDSPDDPDGTRADMGAFYFHQREVYIEPIELLFDTLYATQETQEMTFTVSNLGQQLLTVESVTVADEPYYMDDVAEFTLEQEEERELTVTFAPEDSGHFDGTVTISSNAVNGDVVIALVGNARWNPEGIESSNDVLTAEFSITGICPNPFNSSTSIEYSLTASDRVTLGVYDIRGRLVTMLCDETLPTGRYRAILRADELPSGLYFVRLAGSQEVQTAKIMLIR